MKLIHQGSVKDIYESDAGSELVFQFSDRYSIYDWGQMPDLIPGKGAALSLMGQKLLSHLNQIGIKTHYLGEGTKPNEFRVKKIHVPRGESPINGVIPFYQNALTKIPSTEIPSRAAPTNTLVPLEVIYRFGVPKGSSLLRKYKTEADWKNAGFDRLYQEGELFSEIKLDFTTKLERLDRALTPLEAKTLSGMTDQEWVRLNKLTCDIAKEMQSVFKQSDLRVWDGKFEFAFADYSSSQPDKGRDFILVDSIGLDEMRLTYEGLPLSKELLRQFYHNTEWVKALEIAKKESATEFRKICEEHYRVTPEALPTFWIQAIRSIYEITTEMILNQNHEQVAKLKLDLMQAFKKIGVTKT